MPELTSQLNIQIMKKTKNLNLKAMTLFLRRNIVFVFFSAILIFWVLSFEEGIYHWQWRRAFNYVLRYRQGEWVVGPLLEGLYISLKIVSVSLVLAVTIGLGTAILRNLPSYLASLCAKIYIGLIRNTPLLIQLFVMYFIIAPVFNLDPFWAAAWTLAFFEGAYMAEIFRAGIASISKGQWDAASSSGFSTWQIYVYIVFPQAFRRILPPLTGQTVSLIKDSALVSAIALQDLTMQAQLVIAETFLSLELWIMVAVFYVFLSLFITVPAKMLEKLYVWRWL